MASLLSNITEKRKTLPKIIDKEIANLSH